jgi:RimJ/RimL family protein N-acetyltransferase
MLTIETERLVLVSTPLHVIETRLTCDDFSADVPLTLEGDEGPRTQTWRVHFPPEWPGDALALLPIWKTQLESNPNYEMLGGTMIDRAERVAVGQMSFRAVEEEPGTVELGYGVNPSYQGRGYATEMAGALVRWARRRPDIQRITSACLEDNVPSIRVLQKAGFRQIGHRMDDEGLLILWEYGG